MVKFSLCFVVWVACGVGITKCAGALETERYQGSKGLKALLWAFVLLFVLVVPLVAVWR